MSKPKDIGKRERERENKKEKTEALNFWHVRATTGGVVTCEGDVCTVFFCVQWRGETAVLVLLNDDGSWWVPPAGVLNSRSTWWGPLAFIFLYIFCFCVSRGF